MIYKILEPDPQTWDAFVTRNKRAHVLQLSAWGDLKAAYGWQVGRVALANEQNQLVAGAQMLFQRLPGRVLGSMAYIYGAPYVSAADQWTPLWNAIHKRARQRKAAFLKCEPGVYLNGAQPDFTKWGFVESPQTVQPPRTIVIDVSGDDEAILARMNQGTRRKIRQSQKNEIHYYEGTAADVRKFTAMMETTGDRNEFGVHEPKYYEKAYELFVPNNQAALIMAEHEGDDLAGIMIFALGDTAWYLYGASSSVKRNMMATYGVQWAAIQWARARGCKYYDLWGIPDEDEATLEAQFENRSDGLWGVYGFKRGYGGQVVRSAGTWDKPYSHFIYGGYTLALKWQELNQEA